MTEIKLDIYGGEAEISEFKEGGTELALSFSKEIDGFLGFSGRSFPITGKRCFLSLRGQRDGDIALSLTLSDRIINLPTLIKDGNSVYPAPIDDDFLRRLSRRERILENRVKDLEETVEKLTKSVYGTTLFN